MARQPQLATANVTVNNLLSGRFATARLTQTEGGSAPSPDGIPAGRFGDPAEFGATCAFLCSAQAGYITGQNVLIDGGAYPGTL